MGSADLEFLAIINQYRRDNGVGELTASQTLGAAAQHHSYDMGVNSHFSHTLSDGTSWSQNIVNHGYTFSGRGENLAWGYFTAQSVFEAWRNSPTHNENMLWPTFRAIGVSMVHLPDTQYQMFWTTTFGSTFDTAAVICGQPTPTVAPTRTPVPTATRTSTPNVQPTPTATERVKKCRGRGNPDCQPGVSGKAARGR